MKILEILEDVWDDEDDNRDLPNPLPVVTGKVMERVFDLAEEIDDKILAQYKKVNNIDRISDIETMGKVLIKGRKEAGTMGNVPVSHLVATEEKLESGHFNELLTNKNPRTSGEDIVVLKIGDKFYIQDGNHRAAVAAQQGAKEVPALILDVKALLNKA